jgi:predicted RNA-binding protein with PUA-like domain
MAHWIVKTEPSTYSWSDLARDKRTRWDGIRNHQAKKNLGAMKKGDVVLVYHSGSDKQVVGIARVVREAFPDPADARWLAVDLEAVQALATPVVLADIKQHPVLRDLALVRQGRLSVMPVSARAFHALLALGKTRR